MNLKLSKRVAESYGVFGELSNSETGEMIATTLEHAYPSNNWFYPKLQPGMYTCQRGMHQLHHMKEPFETFEITGVPGHTNILFHIGNTTGDSEGCVLLGSSRMDKMISLSRLTFDKFMNLQLGVNSFTLVVE